MQGRDAVAPAAAAVGALLAVLRHRCRARGYRAPHAQGRLHVRASCLEVVRHRHRHRRGGRVSARTHDGGRADDEARAGGAALVMMTAPASGALATAAVVLIAPEPARRRVGAGRRAQSRAGRRIWKSRGAAWARRWRRARGLRVGAHTSQTTRMAAAGGRGRRRVSVAAARSRRSRARGCSGPSKSRAQGRT